MRRLETRGVESRRRGLKHATGLRTRYRGCSVLLVIKLLLVPALVAAVTLASRRWGLRVAGVVTGLPLVAGPTFAFLAIEQGEVFAADASRSAIAGLVATAAFCVTYGRVAGRMRWAPSLLAGWAAFAAVGAAMAALPNLQGIGELLLALAALEAGRRLVPAPTIADQGAVVPPADLPLRMFTAAAAVVVFTALAGLVGPRISGVLSVFPIVTAILAVFTHIQRGAAASAVFLRGLLRGMDSLAVFCLVLSVTITRAGWHWTAAMALALAAQMLLQVIALQRMARRAR